MSLSTLPSVEGAMLYIITASVVIPTFLMIFFLLGNISLPLKRNRNLAIKRNKDTIVKRNKGTIVKRNKDTVVRRHKAMAFLPNSVIGSIWGTLTADPRQKLIPR